jgi:hypothetical protein
MMTTTKLLLHDTSHFCINGRELSLCHMRNTSRRQQQEGQRSNWGVGKERHHVKESHAVGLPSLSRLFCALFGAVN